LIDDGNLGPSGANEDGAHIRRGGADQRLGGDFIRGRDHDEAGEGAGQADFLDAHLGGAVFADRDAAVGAHDFEIDLRIGGTAAKLFEALVHGEGRETGDEGDLAGQSQACADGRHVGLGDPAGDEPVGELLLKVSGHGGLGKIRVAHDDVAVFAA
jgi:hypothetical protein